jgi:hypothetical protein
MRTAWVPSCSILKLTRRHRPIEAIRPLFPHVRPPQTKNERTRTERKTEIAAAQPWRKRGKNG